MNNPAAVKERAEHFAEKTDACSHLANDTMFGFIAKPEQRLFFKPNVMRRAAEAMGLQFEYESRPNWRTYASA